MFDYTCSAGNTAAEPSVFDMFLTLTLLSLFSGMDRFEAREKLWSDLVETNLAVKKEPYTLRVPRSQRGGEV